jgi:serine/threonine protein kinase
MDTLYRQPLGDKDNASMQYDDEKTRVRVTRMPSSRSGGHPDGSGRANVLPNGTQLNEFEIVGLIGEGGFGIVYLAYDHSLNRHVALKEYMPSALASRTRTLCVTVKSQNHSDNFAIGLKSFINEARMLAQFDSPSLVKVYRFWEANGTAYMVMPYYEGITLKQALKEGRIIPSEYWIKSILANLLDAVEMMHQAQCFHRDIAPDNILLLNDGSPVLLDLGAARQVIGDLTQCLTVIVKPGFAPIEQYANVPGLKQGAWTDVYALAAVVYYLISGKPPPAVARVVSDKMVPARIAGKGRYSEAFLAGIDKALGVMPEQRIQSIPELRAALGIRDAEKEHALASLPPKKQQREFFSGARTRPASADPLPRSATLDGATEYVAMASLHVAARSDSIAVRLKKIAGMPGAGRLVGLAVAALLLIAIAAVAYRGYPRSGAAAGAGAELADAKASAAPPPSRIISTASATAQAPGPATDIAAAAPPVKTEAQVIVSERAPVKTAPLAPVVTPPVPSAESALWKFAIESDAPGGYEAYLKRYPRGAHAASARLRLREKQAKPAADQATDALRESAKQASSRTRLAAAASPSASVASDAAGGRASATPRSVSAADEAKSAGAANKMPAAPQTAGPGPASDDASKPPELGTAPAKTQARETASGIAQEQAPAAGKRTIRFEDQVMTGDFTVDPKSGIVSGKGRVVWSNGNQFEGTLVKGVKEGRGQLIWANGQRYSGDWLRDSPNGKGTLIYPNGNRYEGEVKDGIPNGEGKFRYKGGDVYSGAWVNGKSHGHGRYTWANGSYFEGEFKDGKRTENGKLVVVNNAADAARRDMEVAGN